MIQPKKENIKPKKYTADFVGAKVEFIDPLRRNWGVICYVEGFGEEHVELGLTEEQAMMWWDKSAPQYLEDAWRDEGGGEYAAVTVCAFKMTPFIKQVGYFGSGYESEDYKLE